MSNVLPEKSLRAVWNRFRDRMVLTGALVFFGVAVLSGLALLPAYIVLQVEQKSLAQQDILDSAMSNLNPRDKAEQNDIVRAQSFLARITPFISATSSTTKIIETALALRPKGVRINGVSITDQNRRKITVEGVAPGREEINRYRETLLTSGHFNSVSIPVGTLVGVEGGKFTITLTSAY